MPYIIVPKGQPHMWAFLWRPEWTVHLGSQIETLRKYHCPYTSDYAEHYCPCCGRTLAHTNSSHVVDYAAWYGYICARCEEQLVTGDWTLHPSYPDRLTATTHYTAKTQDIVFRPTRDDFARIHAVKTLVTSIPIPWENDRRFLPCTSYHHARLTAHGLVEYFRDVEAAYLQRTTAVKPAKYLAEFYPTLSQAEIATYVAHVAAFTTATYELARTPEEITTIYNTTAGPDSCMRRKKHSEYDWQTLLDAGRLPAHPCAIYGHSDLALAYTGPITSISQRAFVWPEKKHYVRVYGTGPLEHLLRRDGYTKANFIGAKLRHVRFTDPDSDISAILTPYVDWTNERSGSSSYSAYSADVSDDQQWLILAEDNDSGAISLDQTRGHSSNDIYAEQPDDPDDYSMCEACEGSYLPDDLRDGYCATCWLDIYFSCAYCHEDYRREDHAVLRTRGGRLMCDECREHHTITCEQDGCGETYIEDTFLSSDRNARRNGAVTHLCLIHGREALAARMPTTATTPIVEVTQQYEVRVYGNSRSSGGLNLARMRPDDGYVVQLTYNVLAGTFDQCAETCARMQDAYPNLRYAVHTVPMETLSPESEVTTHAESQTV